VNLKKKEMKKIVTLLIVVLGIGLQNQVFGQKNAEGTMTTLKLYPSIIDITIKGTTIYCLLTREESQDKWKILVTEDQTIILTLRNQDSPGVHKFESLRIKRKKARKIFRSVKRKDRDLDYKVVSPYKVYLLFNTDIRPSGE
jgi:hypothetical protein